MMKILSKEHLKLFQFPENKISNNQKVISGIKKGVTQAIILSTGVNSSNSKSFIDIRLWAMNDSTEKYVPTVKVISIDSLLEDDEETVNPFKHTTT